jgi:hypothetical protein
MINSIEVDYGTGSVPPHGGNRGNPDTFSLADDEWLTEIRGQCGSKLDHIQFFLSSGRVSAIYGGNGGRPFRETTDNSIIKAFYGRSGSLVDQIGVYFANAQPLSMVITSMTYDVSRLIVADLPPVQVFHTVLKNVSGVTQQLTQSETIEISETKSTTVAETNQVNVTVTFQTDFLIAGSQISVGYTKDETVTTGTSHTYTKNWTVNFSVEVPPYSKMNAIAVLKQGAYDVP